MKRNMYRFLRMFLYAGMLLSFNLFAFTNSGSAQSGIDNLHYTTINQVGLTITNFGVLGEGYRNPDQPSCMYKQYPDSSNEQIEHLSYGGLWVGGKVNGKKRVSTAIMDGVFDYGSSGFEFSHNGYAVTERSSLLSSPVYSPDAISHQDFQTTYYDTGMVDDHTPMNIRVDQTSYAWDRDDADAFVILSYHITNLDTSSIQDIFLGFWADAAVGNMNYTNIYVPGGGWSWYDNLNGFDESVFDPDTNDAYPGLDRDIAYQYDDDGDSSNAQSYFGMSFLGSITVPRAYWDTYYNQWKWNTALDADYPEYFMPTTDNQRYDKLTTSVAKHIGESNYTAEGYPSRKASWVMLMGAGPFGSVPVNTDSSSWELPPGESMDVSLVIVCGEWADSGLTDNGNRRSILRAHADCAQRVFNGEDLNGNGRLDNGEDLDGDGIIDRFIFPVNSAIDPKNYSPDDFQLNPVAYPNPFNPTATIKFQTHEQRRVTIQVFDIAGRFITTLLDGPLDAGDHEVIWNAGDIGSGIYVYRLQSGDHYITRKLALIK